MPELSPAGALARRGDPDRFLCALFAPAPKREALFALIAFNHELARAREVTSQPMATLIRLQWWHEAVEEAAAGRPARRHEVAAPLHAAITSGALAAADLLSMVEARDAEVEEETPSRGALDAVLRGTGGGMMVAAGRLLGAPATLLPALEAAGAAHALAGLLAGLPAIHARGRCPMPPELLDAHGATGCDPREATVLAAMRRMAADALPGLASARATLRALPRAALAAALPAVLAGRDLRRFAAGRGLGEPPGPRRAADRLAIALAGLRGRV